MDLMQSWLKEKRSAYLYKIIAAKEKNSRYQTLFSELAKAAEEQSELWEKQLQQANIKLPTLFKPDMRTRFIGWLIRRFNPRHLRYILSANEIRGMSIYLEGLLAQTTPKTIEDMQNAQKNATNGNNLRAAVFGVNDGLVSNAGLIFGMAGAHANFKMLLLAGVTGLLAGACSMAAGEFISVKSQREMYEYQIGLEQKELEFYPEEEAAELALIYQARGLPKEEAEKMANLIVQDPEKALNTLAREELGLNPDDLGSPWGAAISSFLSFTVGAFIPLIPYLFKPHNSSLLFSIGLTGTTLFLIGLVISLFVGKHGIKGGLRMLAIGGGAGMITYFIGHLINLFFLS